MNKTVIIVTLTTLIIIIAGVFLVTKDSGNGGGNEPLPSPTSYEYYWGNGCPHCTNVESFLEGWDPPTGEAGKKVQITKYEVWNNTGNAKRMEQRATTCGIKPQNMGIPLLFTPDGKCYSGDQPIIDYFKSIK